MCLKWAHHSFWRQIVFTFIHFNSFPTSPLSVAKESIAVEKCIRQTWSWRDAPHISTVISLLIHLIVDVKKCVRHFFVRTHPLYMRPLDLFERARLGRYHVKSQLVQSDPECDPITTNYLLTNGLSLREPSGVVIESCNDQSHQRLSPYLYYIIG